MPDLRYVREGRPGMPSDNYMGDMPMCVEKLARISLLGFAALLVTVVLLPACTDIHKSADYERHLYSQFVVPYDRNDIMYFDVKINVEFPDDEAGEATRMKWLGAWLAQRNMCGDNFNIAERRPFDPMENNPAHYDIRYEVTCATEPEG